MATYNLNAADLITLLQSTVTPSTEGAILDALIHNGDFPQANDVYNTQTNVGPGLNSPPLTTQDIVIGSPNFTPILELITLPTSTDVPGARIRRLRLRARRSQTSTLSPQEGL